MIVRNTERIFRVINKPPERVCFFIEQVEAVCSAYPNVFPAVFKNGRYTVAANAAKITRTKIVACKLFGFGI